MTAPSVNIVQMTDVRFGWSRDNQVIRIPELSISRGEHVFLRGPSGSGKTTLLSLIAGILAPNGGRIELLGRDMVTLSPRQRDGLRADQLGVVFQMFNLVPYLSVVENVILPCRFSPARARRVRDRGGAPDREAKHLLGRLGLGDRGILERTVTKLSVGQQQRVAAARALIGSPALIIADEPTSALDADARSAFIDLLLEECSAAGSALLFVSHDSSLATHFHRQLSLPDINRVELSAV